MSCPLCGHLKCRCLEVEAVQEDDGSVDYLPVRRRGPAWMKPSLARRLAEEAKRVNPEAKREMTKGLTDPGKEKP